MNGWLWRTFASTSQALLKAGGTGAASLLLLTGCLEGQGSPTLAGLQVIEGPLCSGSEGSFAGGGSQDEVVDEGGGFVSQRSRYSTDALEGYEMLLLEDCATGHVSRASHSLMPRLATPEDAARPALISLDELMPTLRQGGQAASLDALVSLAAEQGYRADKLDWSDDAPSCRCQTFYPDLVAERAP